MSLCLESPARQTLAVMWQVREVNLIDAAIGDKTSRKRHRFVFTKLRAFEVPYRKIIFFDLDIIVRRLPGKRDKDRVADSGPPVAVDQGWSAKERMRSSDESITLKFKRTSDSTSSNFFGPQVYYAI